MLHGADAAIRRDSLMVSREFDAVTGPLKSDDEKYDSKALAEIIMERMAAVKGGTAATLLVSRQSGGDDETPSESNELAVRETPSEGFNEMVAGEPPSEGDELVGGEAPSEGDELVGGEAPNNELIAGEPPCEGDELVGGEAPSEGSNELVAGKADGEQVCLGTASGATRVCVGEDADIVTNCGAERL